MSVVPASARRTVRVNGHMSDLGAHAAKTLNQVVVADDAAADAGADGEIDQVVVPLARAKFPLGKPCHVGIVVKIYRDAEMLGEFGTHREVSPFFDVGCFEDRSGVRVEWTRGCNANGIHFFLGPDRFDGANETVKDAGLIGERTRPGLGDRFGAIGFVCSNADMRSANVYGNCDAHISIITDAFKACFPRVTSTQLRVD